MCVTVNTGSMNIKCIKPLGGRKTSAVKWEGQHREAGRLQLTSLT